MMEESHEILLNSLKSFGIEIPSEISSVGAIDADTLLSICNQSLRRLPLLTPEVTPSSPTSTPDSMAGRLRICTDVASILRYLGFDGDISFHKFLYPSEEDLYKLVRFLVKRLSEASEATEIAEPQVIHGGTENLEQNCESTSEACSETTAHQEVLEFSANNDLVIVGKSNKEVDAVSENFNQSPSLGVLCTRKDSCENDDIRHLTETFRDFRQNDCLSEDTQRDVQDVPKSLQGLTSFQELSSEEIEILKEARRKEFNGEDLADFQQRNEQGGAGKLNLQQLEDLWAYCRRPLEDGKILLLKSLQVSNPDVLGKLQILKDIELETESVLCKIKNREEECAKLAAELEKQAKVASRRSYVERVTEITKNSRKQDADIERISKETRELQLESNAIEERLHRSYAVVDEMVFREAKKDIASRQAYRLLTSIHNSFEEIREKIIETDRTRREVGDIEVKLGTISSRSLDMQKLQADLDAIQKENESLERKLHGPL